MDKEILKVKSKLDKDMKNLVKKDKKRDAACEKSKKMAKRK